MNAKVIVALSALFACACDAKQYSAEFWDESSGKLKVDSILTITKVDDHFHGAFSNVEVLDKEGVTAENVLPSQVWALKEPVEVISFDFTLNPADRTYTVTFPDGTSASAKGFVDWILKAVSQGKALEYYYAKGEKPPTREAVSFFGNCGVKNVNKVNEGDDLILTFNVDHANCSQRNPLIPSPVESDSDTQRYVFYNGNYLTQISDTISVAINGVTHNLGAKLVEVVGVH